MTNKEPTQLEKTLVIAKTMYGDASVNATDQVLLPTESGQHGIRVFNPYTSSEDSQAVQEFFKRYFYLIYENGKYKPINCHDSPRFIFNNGNKDLKTAIADAAYLACKEKENDRA